MYIKIANIFMLCFDLKFTASLPCFHTYPQVLEHKGHSTCMQSLHQKLAPPHPLCRDSHRQREPTYPSTQKHTSMHHFHDKSQSIKHLVENFTARKINNSAPIVFISWSLILFCAHVHPDEQYSPITILTLQQQLLLHKVLSAHRASDKTRTWPTVGIVVLPLAVETWCVGPTLDTAHTPAQK